MMGAALIAATVGAVAAILLVARTAFSTERLVAVLLGQPAVLQHALESSSDSRIKSGYTATFAIALIYKIVIVPVLLVV